MELLTAVFSGFGLAVLAPWLGRWLGARAGYLLALLPAGLAVLFARYVGALDSGAIIERYDWFPQAGLALSFYLDGLSLLFALLITVVGAIVLVYTVGYLEAEHGTIYLYLLAFMGSMLGLVLAGNLLTLYVFWELTTITSFLLIGFDHEREAARAAAVQGLIVTGLGGLALLAGLVMLGLAAGTFELATLLAGGDTVRQHELYEPILVLMLLGAFTKSAQFPFHFWLPGAMEAPAPVSAYLHSATMVKAGIYLLARFTPVLGGTELWTVSVTSVGAVTMLVGAFLALMVHDLKGILAYLTINVLGTLTLLLGLGTDRGHKAALVYLLAHAFYKGALFLITGIVDHETGIRDTRLLGGLARKMPIAAFVAIVSAISMAGIIPLFGFVAKETFLEAVWYAPRAAMWLTLVAVIGSIFVTAAAGVIAGPVFLGRMTLAAEPAHEAHASLWIGPLLLSVGSICLGVWPDLLATPLVAPAYAAIARQPADFHLELWHGPNVAFALSLIALAAGVMLFWTRSRVQQALPSEFGATWGPEAQYRNAMYALTRLAEWQSRLLQSGLLRRYVLILVIATAMLAGVTVLRMEGPYWPEQWDDIHFHEGVAALLVVLAALAAVWTNSRMTAVAALGVIGFNVSWLFILYGAPDLAMTQIVVESLIVILFVLAFHRLPAYALRSSFAVRIRDALVSIMAGGLFTVLLLLVTRMPHISSASAYYAANSVPEAHGRNVVNVILVDFRALDTLGEITVLSTAAVGVYALLKWRLSPPGE